VIVNKLLRHSESSNHVEERSKKRPESWTPNIDQCAEKWDRCTKVGKRPEMEKPGLEWSVEYMPNPTMTMVVLVMTMIIFYA